MKQIYQNSAVSQYFCLVRPSFFLTLLIPKPSNAKSARAALPKTATPAEWGRSTAKAQPHHHHPTPTSPKLTTSLNLTHCTNPPQPSKGQHTSPFPGATALHQPQQWLQSPQSSPCFSPQLCSPPYSSRAPRSSKQHRPATPCSPSPYPASPAATSSPSSC